MVEDELKYIYKLYRIPASIGTTFIGLGEDLAQPPNGAMVMLSDSLSVVSLSLSSKR